MDLDIYDIDGNNEHRYLLGKRGFRQIIVIGVNPSTATDQTPDKTLSNVISIIENQGYDGFCMINLYPLRSTDFESLPPQADREQMDLNVQKVKELLAESHYMALWAAWGNSISKRDYLKEALRSLVQGCELENYIWKSYNELTLEGHPRHPSRVALNGRFLEFDITNYLESLSDDPFNIS